MIHSMTTLITEFAWLVKNGERKKIWNTSPKIGEDPQSKIGNHLIKGNKTMKIKPNIELICGCCGSYFKTWEGYVDQDHDRGYGVCQPCQEWIKEKEETEYKKLMDQAIKLIKKSLNEENSKGFSKMSRKKQEAMANGMIKEGILKIGYGSAMRGA